MKTRILIMTVIILLSLLAASSGMASSGSPKVYLPLVKNGGQAAASLVSSPAGLPTWEQVFDPVPTWGNYQFWIFGAAFKDKMYLNGFWDETSDQVWSTSDGKNWFIACDLSSFLDGYEGAWGPTFTFKNQLYITMYDWDWVLPPVLVRTPDGQNWQVVVTYSLDLYDADP